MRLFPFQTEREVYFCNFSVEYLFLKNVKWKLKTFWGSLWQIAPRSFWLSGLSVKHSGFRWRISVLNRKEPSTLDLLLTDKVHVTKSSDYNKAQDGEIVKYCGESTNGTATQALDKPGETISLDQLGLGHATRMIEPKPLHSSYIPKLSQTSHFPST